MWQKSWLWLVGRTEVKEKSVPGQGYLIDLSFTRPTFKEKPVKT